MSSLLLGLPPIPPPPDDVIERITGRTSPALYNRREAEREYDAYLSGEDYTFEPPVIGSDGYVKPPGTESEGCLSQAR